MTNSDFITAHQHHHQLLRMFFVHFITRIVRTREIINGRNKLMAVFNLALTFSARYLSFSPSFSLVLFPFGEFRVASSDELKQFIDCTSLCNRRPVCNSPKLCNRERECAAGFAFHHRLFRDSPWSGQKGDCRSRAN